MSCACAAAFICGLIFGRSRWRARGWSVARLCHQVRQDFWVSLCVHVGHLRSQSWQVIAWFAGAALGHLVEALFVVRLERLRS